MTYELRYAGIARDSADVPGDLLVYDGALGTRVVDTLVSCGGIIIEHDGSISNWSSIFSTAVRYNAAEERS